MDPPALTCQAVGPTRGASSQVDRPIDRPIGNLGHAPKFVNIGNLGNDLLFVTIGNLGHAPKFVNIGNLGNVLVVAKIANDFGWLHAFGGGKGTQPKIIGNIGKIVMPFKLA